MIKFVGGFDTVRTLPNTQFPEYAFIGRSNVGKSSLINAVLRQNVARTSNTPGRTQTINMFNVDDRVMIVDLPGYGYARVSRDVAQMWVDRLCEYLTTRRTLRRLYILIDARIGCTESDMDMMNFCDANGVPYTLVYTKCDKRVREQDQTTPDPGSHGAMHPDIYRTSATKKTGLDGIRRDIGIK